MNMIKNIYLDEYKFDRRKKFSIEYSWKAVFRIVPASNDFPEFYFVVVSNNYLPPKGLHIDAEQEELDILSVCQLIANRFNKFNNQSGHRAELGKYFIIDE